MKRRDFLGSGLIAGFSWLQITPSALRAKEAADGPVFSQPALPQPGFRLSRDVSTRLYDDTKCWCHPRAGIVPNRGADGAPRVVMTMNTIDLVGSDIFRALHSQETDNLGAQWTEPQPQETLAPWTEMNNGEQCPVAVSDFWPMWHAGSKTLLGTGHTVVYTPEWEVKQPRPRDTAYATYDGDTGRWGEVKKMAMPPGPEFVDAGAGCTQRYDLADGTILLPIYFRPPNKNSQVTITRCAFDGQVLEYQDHGDVLNVDDATRGLHEPSLTRFDGQYFLTIRNDKQGYVTRGEDGMRFEPYRPWLFDDGQELGNYNTQQHWVTHRDGLFLVYTRRGANNDHVFRNRAPLFMAQVDPNRLCVLRETEQILVPERGARLGNFGITRVSDQETWVTVAEVMYSYNDRPRDSDGSVYVARIHWAEPDP